MGRKQIHRLAAWGWITISHLHQNGGPSSSKWLTSDRRDPGLPFLANHADTTWACDFIQAYDIPVRQGYLSQQASWLFLAPKIVGKTVLTSTSKFQLQTDSMSYRTRSSVFVSSAVAAQSASIVRLLTPPATPTAIHSMSPLWIPRAAGRAWFELLFWYRPPEHGAVHLMGAHGGGSFADSRRRIRRR